MISYSHYCLRNYMSFVVNQTLCPLCIIKMEIRCNWEKWKWFVKSWLWNSGTAFLSASNVLYFNMNFLFVSFSLCVYFVVVVLFCWLRTIIGVMNNNLMMFCALHLVRLFPLTVRKVKKAGSKCLHKVWRASHDTFQSCLSHLTHYNVWTNLLQLN